MDMPVLDHLVPHQRLIGLIVHMEIQKSLLMVVAVMVFYTLEETEQEAQIQNSQWVWVMISFICVMTM